MKMYIIFRNWIGESILQPCLICPNFSDRLAKTLQLSDEVLFLPSISDELKYSVLRESIALLYTPENEHFGITPLEAMAVGRPVIACDSGGPCETIIHESTGLLVKGGAQVSSDWLSLLEYSNARWRRDLLMVWCISTRTQWKQTGWETMVGREWRKISLSPTSQTNWTASSTSGQIGHH